MTFEIRQGDALTVLKGMPDESVQCVVTSPPYYGLRSYGTEPQVWGNHNGCSHVFGEAIKNPKADLRTPEEKIAQGGSVGTNVATLHWSNGNLGNFCQSCNAWRGELGLEPTFKLYIEHLIEIFAEVKRVLKKDGTCFVNLGDSYGTNSGNAPSISTGAAVSPSKEAIQTRYSNPYIELPKVLHKSLLNIPSRFAIAMTDTLRMIQRNEIIWHKPACMPSSAKDRFTVDFEKIFFFVKSPKYKFNQQLERTITRDVSIRNRDITKLNNTPGRTRMAGLTTNDYEYKNKRTTWTVNFEPSGDEHFAAYPTKLVEPMILAGTDEGDTVLDIFSGTATTGVTALRNRRSYIGIELNPEYIKISERRLKEIQVKLF